MPRNLNTAPGSTPIQDGATIRVKPDGTGWESHKFVDTSDLATVATSGSYDDLDDQPTIPSIDPQAITDLDAENASAFETAEKVNELIEALREAGVLS